MDNPDDMLKDFANKRVKDIGEEDKACLDRIHNLFGPIMDMLNDLVNKEEQ